MTISGLGARLRQWARLMKRDAIALWIAARDPRTPRLAKITAAAVAAYALSPIDLIPDFVPVLGYLDDVILVPLGIVLMLRLIPDALIVEFRHRASEMAERPTSRASLAIVVTIWAAFGGTLVWWIWRGPASYR